MVMVITFAWELVQRHDFKQGEHISLVEESSSMLSVVKFGRLVMHKEEPPRPPTEGM